MIQQGDCLLVKLNSLPEGKLKIINKGRCILAEGEHTGHAHIVEDDEAELIAIGETMLLKLGNQTILTHQEHGPITLEPGIYQIGRVVEKDWLSGMVKPVVD